MDFGVLLIPNWGDTTSKRRINRSILLNSQVSSLTSAVEDLHAQIASMKIFIFVLISLVFAILAVLVYNAYNVTAADANPAMVAAVEDMCATASTPSAAAHQHVTATGEL